MAIRDNGWATSLVVITMLGVNALELAGQRVLGQVRDEATGTLVVGAVVTARASSGDIVAYALTDDLGEYALSLPGHGTYTFDAQSAGYGRRVARDIGVEGELPLLMHFELGPEPIELEGIGAEVRVRRAIEDDLQRVGLSLSDVLEARIVTREEIAEQQSAKDIGAVLEWQNIAGARVVRSHNFNLNSSPILCVAQVRGRSLTGDRCSLTVLNGNPITLESALDIAPDDVESMVILTPVQATLVYGTTGGGGAVLIYTRTR